MANENLVSILNGKYNGNTETISFINKRKETIEGTIEKLKIEENV